MKKTLFLLWLLLLLLISCSDKKQYVISGNNAGFRNGYKVYLCRVQSEEEMPLLLNSSVIADNSFVMKGRVEVAHSAVLLVCDSTHIDEKSFELISDEGAPFAVDLFLEQGKIDVTPYDRESKLPAVASGTPLNELYNKFKTDVDSVKKNVGTDPNTTFGFVVPFIKENLFNPVGVTVFECWHWSMPKEMKLELLDLLVAEYGDAYVSLRDETAAELEYQRKRAEQAASVRPGCKYKDFSERNVDGKDVSLKSVVENGKNSYVLLGFWATWCTPCMNEIPSLLDAYKNYKSKGFEIYSVSLDDDETVGRWTSVVNEKGMKWINVRAAKDCDVRDRYGIFGIPANFLIDCFTGEIVAAGLHGDALAKKLAEIFD